MKYKYTVYYKIKKDYPESDIENHFEIIEENEEKAKKVSIEVLRELYGLEDLDDDSISQMITLEKEDIVENCEICDKNLFLSELKFYEIVYKKNGEDVKKIYLCDDCLFKFNFKLNELREIFQYGVFNSNNQRKE